jgi:hypothetical protein
MSESQPIVDAINDLTRVILATQGTFTSRSETVRKLAELSIPPGRIASILAMKVSDVSSVIAKDKKRASKENVSSAS